MLTIIKKDGTTEPWSFEKILNAVAKASERVNEGFTKQDEEKLEDEIIMYLSDGYTKNNILETKDLHSIVIYCLKQIGKYNIAQAYQEFRDYKTTHAHEFGKLKDEADRILYLGDTENANFDSSLVSTKGSLIKGYLTKSLYKQFYLSKKEKELTKRGDIYIHDLRDMLMNSINCCLFDIGNLLKGGFNMSNIHYTEPKSVLSALQVIGDVTLCASAQQFGGFTLAELDKVLLPYCKKTYRRAFIKYFNTCNVDYSIAINLAMEDVKRELEQGFQSLELKLNTIPSSRGDFAFTTITFGQWDIMMDDRPREFMKMIGETILETRRKGHSGTPVVFPKLVYLYDENQIEQDPDSKELFNLAVKCSSECMYPDYLSLTGSPETNAVAKLYLSEGVITSPMGCRAYLTPWKDPKTNKFITIGRCNIGAVSLNLPVIVAVAKNEAEKQKILGVTWKDQFWKILDDRLETIREFLKKRYDIIRHTKASTNPLAFTEGGFHNGYLDPNDEIGDLVNYMTASFGITALNETSILWNGKTLNEDSSIANTIIDHINAKIEEFKKEDGYLYALYGTPAESLCHTQAVQYRDYTGDNQFGEYFTNSFHLHVSSKISPIEKQDKEYVLFHKCNGGHIQYVRLDNPTNYRAVASLIVRGMDKGFYQGVNFDSVYCNECGKHSFNSSLHCPHCGSRNLTVISRVCGYLGYSKINGSTRMNEGKLAEIKDRVSM